MKKISTIVGGVAVFIIAIFAILAVFGSFYTIQSGERGILTHWGKVALAPVEPGFHFKVPFRDGIYKMDVRIQKFGNTESAASRDLQDVSADVVTNWHVIPKSAPSIYTRVGTLRTIEATIITPAIANAVKSTTAQYNAEDIIAHRQQISAKITEALNKAMGNYDIVIDAVNLTNIAFSPAYKQAIERKQVSQQQAQQAQYELQKTKVDAQQKVVVAQAEANARIAAAKADAENQITLARAKSEAQALLQKTLTTQILVQQAITAWDGKLPSVFAGSGASGLVNMIPPVK